MKLFKFLLGVIFFILFTVLYLLPFSLLWVIGVDAEDKDYLYFNWMLDVFFERFYKLIELI